MKYKAAKGKDLIDLKIMLCNSEKHDIQVH